MCQVQRTVSTSTRNLNEITNGLKGPFDLSAARKPASQNFQMSTKYLHFGMKGEIHNSETYILNIQHNPNTTPAADLDQYTCMQLQLQTNDGSAVRIPELMNWTYAFNPTQVAPIWGISQDKFNNLTNGQKPLPFTIRYASYVNFIDFHSINDIFTRPMKWANKGVQDLKEIGQTTVHPTSFIQAPVSFGTEVKSGSIFQNGQVTLELKGVSIVDEAPCALVGYDAGESKLKMITHDSTGQESITEGGSQYKGDIYIDLATRWVRRATLDEYQITETSTQGVPSKNSEYTVRHILLRLTGS
jgi:hypothetical protein